jgi:hypothetical protein
MPTKTPARFKPSRPWADILSGIDDLRVNLRRGPDAVQP